MRKDLLLTGAALDKRVRKIIMKQANLDKIQKRQWIKFINSHSC